MSTQFWLSYNLLINTVNKTPALREMGLHKLMEPVHKRVGHYKAFVTFNVDVVVPAFAPGTETPKVGGLTGAEAIDLVRGLRGLKGVGILIRATGTRIFFSRF